METRERILNKAHELFMLYGIRSVSMDEIAAHLGISKKTIYQFFADKDALVDGVIDIEMTNNTCDCEANKEKSDNAIHEIYLGDACVDDLLKVMNPSMIYDLEKYHNKSYTKIHQYKNKFLFEFVKDNLERGIAEGIYRDDINVEVIARFRLASVFLLFNTDQFPHGKHTLPQILTEISDNFLHGIASAKGLKLIQKYKQQISVKQ